MAAHPDEDEHSVRECLDDIEELVRQGRLFKDDTAIRQAAVSDKKPAELKALCLNIAHTCNLTCSYCFAGQGSYKGRYCLDAL